MERIVRRLDGLPLALELAAARARTLTLDEIDSGLDDRFALLAAGPRTSDPRHQTLRALVDWSWETLSGAEREALLAASVFPDGIAAVDAAAVAERFETDAAAFDRLVDRSLLRRGDGAYRMLETVRAYGLDRLRAAGGEPDARRRQAVVMAELARTRDDSLRGPEVRRALDWFDANEENLSAALRACAEQPGLHETGVALVRGSLWQWLMRERFPELEAGIRRFSSADGAIDSEPATVVNGVALLFAAMARDRADDPLAEALGDFGPRSDRLAEAARRHPSALTHVLRPLLSAIAEAIDRRVEGGLWAQSFRIPDPAPDAPSWSWAFVSMLRSAVAQNMGDVETLGLESERAMDGFRRLGDVWGTAFASQLRGEWLALEGRLEEALEVADASTRGFTGLTSVSDLLQQRSQSLGILLRLGRIEEARARLAEIDVIARNEGSDRTLAQLRMSAASVEIAAGDGAAALAHLDKLPKDARAPGFPDQMTAWAASKRAQALILLSRLEEAGRTIAMALPLARRTGDQPILADVILSLAGWLAATDQRAAAHRAVALSSAVRGRADVTDVFYRLVLADGDAAPEEILLGAASDELDGLAALLPQPPA